PYRIDPYRARAGTRPARHRHAEPGRPHRRRHPAAAAAVRRRAGAGFRRRLGAGAGAAETLRHQHRLGRQGRAPPLRQRGQPRRLRRQPAGRMRKLVNILLPVVGVLYPVLVYFGMETVAPAVFALALAAGWLLRAPFVWREPGGRWMLGVALAYCAMLAVSGDSSLMRWYPPLISLFLLFTFGLSLVYGPPVLERIARVREPE